MANATATFTPLTDDDFNRSDTATGTVTGPAIYASPSTGENYTDFKGGTWKISGNTLVPTGLTPGDFSVAYLARPSAETEADGKVAVTGSPGIAGSALCAVTRLQSDGAAYGTYIYGDTSGVAAFGLAIVGPGSGAQTPLASSARPTTASAAEQFVITLSALSTSPTYLQATLALASSPDTIIATLIARDGTAALQATGVNGLSANVSGSGIGSGNVSITRLVTYSAGNVALPLTVGALSASGALVSLAAAPGGGTGSGYSTALYRGTDPNFTPGAGNLLATDPAFPYADATAVPGIQYFYGLIVTDTGNNATTPALPAGVGTSWTPTYTPLVAAQVMPAGTVVAFIGDSITHSAGVTNAGTTLLPTMPGYCMARLKILLGDRNIVGINMGVSGHTLTDWAPAGPTYLAARIATRSAVNANPTARLVFSIMLGANDSASSGTNNSPSGILSAANYQAKLTALVSQLRSDFPGCRCIVHMPTYYTPNTRNDSVYEQPGLSALFGYRTAIVATVAAIGSGSVVVGDTASFAYFAANYASEHQAEPAANGNGIFYLHPSGTAGANGLIGTQSLGEMHADAIARNLFGGGSAVPPTSRA